AGASGRQLLAQFASAGAYCLQMWIMSAQAYVPDESEEGNDMMDGMFGDADKYLDTLMVRLSSTGEILFWLHKPSLIIASWRRVSISIPDAQAGDSLRPDAGGASRAIAIDDLSIRRGACAQIDCNFTHDTCGWTSNN